MSESPQLRSSPAPARLGLDDLAARLDAWAVVDASELRTDIWDSDEELDAFLADVRDSRNASVA